VVPLPPCCDVCSGEVESIDATRDAQIVMSAMVRTGERFGIGHIVDVVCGADTQRIRDLGHDRIKTYGVGKDRDKGHWRLVVDNLLAQGLILQTTGEYPVLRLEPAARNVLFGDEEFVILRTIKTKTKRPRVSEAGPYNEELFEELRDLRKRLAAEQGVPPYVVFSDRTLHEMARSFPTREAELLSVSGVGEAKLARYGDVFAAAIRAFLARRPEIEHPISNTE
jgi:ATP-dependent DNA helicase RecQ